MSLTGVVFDTATVLQVASMVLAATAVIWGAIKAISMANRA